MYKKYTEDKRFNFKYTQGFFEPFDFVNPRPKKDQKARFDGKPKES
jgi:hypothetical protein